MTQDKIGSNISAYPQRVGYFFIIQMIQEDIFRKLPLYQLLARQVSRVTNYELNLCQ